jgi:hypothetical protein
MLLGKESIMAKIKRDCFGYSAIREDCYILKKLYCRNENCKFYKTRKEYEQGRKKYDK